MNAKIDKSIIIGIGNTGALVVSKFRKKLLRFSGNKEVPVISLLEICNEACLNAVDSSTADSIQPIQHILLDTRDIDDNGTAALPPEYVKLMDQHRENELPDTRQGWNLRFFENAPIVAASIGEAVSKVISARAGKAMADMGLEPRSGTDIEVLIVGDLGDPFSSSMIVDLPYVAQYEIDGKLANEKINRQYTGVWFLPESTDAIGEVEDVEKRRELEHKRQAVAYAALKELDYFMSRARYERVFRVGDLKVTKNVPPYNYTYIVDSVNESNQGIPVLSQMAELVSEWMFLALTTAMGDDVRKQGNHTGDVRSYGKLAMYSGLGLSEYLLPIEELIKVESLRLGLDMTGKEKGLLNELPEDTKTGVVFSLDSSSVLPEISKGECRKKEEAVTTIPSTIFKNIPVYDLAMFFDRVGRTFEYSYVKRLREAERCMSEHLGELLDEKEKQIRNRVFSKIDEQLIGGISLALRAIRDEKEEVENLTAKHRIELKQRSEALEAESRELKGALAAYVSSVYSFYPEKIKQRAVVWLALLAFVVLSLWLSITSFMMAKDNLAGMISNLRGGTLSNTQELMLNVSTFLMLIAALVGIALSVFVAVEWTSRTRQKYIDSYTTRLKAAVDKLKTEMMVHFYEGIQTPLQEIHKEVVDLRDKIEKAREILQKRLEEPHKLYGTLGLLIAESVIEEEDVDEIYERTVGDNIEERIRDFSQERWFGPISSWLQYEPEKIAEGIMEFGERYMTRIKEDVDAEMYLKKHAAPIGMSVEDLSTWKPQDNEDNVIQRIQDKIKKLLDSSKPFLRYNTTALENSVDPHLIQTIGFYRANDNKSAVIQAVNKIKESRGEGSGSHLTVKVIPDKFSIITMSARHGLPLYSVGTLLTYRTQYVHRRMDAGMGLHLRTKYLMLPDVFPMQYEGEVILEPQEAVALGIAFGKIRWNARKKSYSYRYYDQTLRKEVPVFLGKDKTSATVYLQDHVDILAMISKEIDDEVTNRSKAAAGGKGSNRPIIDFLIDYREKAKRSRSERKKLEEWEDLVIEEYINKLSV